MLCLYCLCPPPFFQILSNFPPPSTSLLPATPTHTVLSVVLFLWLNAWSHHIWYVILLNDNMDLDISSLGTLILEGRWCVFYATRCLVYWGLTNAFFYWHSDLISHKHKQHTQGPVGWHTHINIYSQHPLRAHSSYLYYIKWINDSLISKTCFPQYRVFSTGGMGDSPPHLEKSPPPVDSPTKFLSPHQKSLPPLKIVFKL